MSLVSIHLILWKHHEVIEPQAFAKKLKCFNPSHFMEASRSSDTFQLTILNNPVSIHLILWKHHEDNDAAAAAAGVASFNPSHFMEASRRLTGRYVKEFVG